MFTPMAFTVVFALVGALFALTVVPVLLSYFMTAKISGEDNFIQFVSPRGFTHRCSSSAFACVG